NSSFEVRGASLVETTRGDLAIVVNRGCSGVVLDSTIQNNAGIGIVFALGGGGNVYNSTIQGNGASGIFLSTGASASISNNTIADNLGNGVDVIGDSFGEFTDNRIQNNHGGAGILFDQGSSGTVTGSTITNNGDGIDVGYSSTANVDGNTIEGGTVGV